MARLDNFTTNDVTSLQESILNELESAVERFMPIVNTVKTATMRLVMRGQIFE
jgi:hypothetical protein